MNRKMIVSVRTSQAWICACAAAILCWCGGERLSAQDSETAAVEEAVFMEEGGPTSELVTLNVQNADITQVLHAFSRQTGKSVVIGPEVTGEVTMRLTDIPWNDALDVILKPYGYGYQTVGETIVVNRLEKMVTVESLEPIVARVFSLKYLDASDVREVVESQLSPRGHMSVLTVRGQKGWKFESSSTSRQARQGVASIGKRERIEDDEGQVRSKTLVVADIASVVEKIAAILEQVDTMPGQVLIEARFLEINADNLQDLGVEFGTGATGAERAGVQPNAYDAGGAIYGAGVQQISGGVQPQNFPSDSAVGARRPFDAGMSLVFQRLTETQFEILLHMVQEDVSANILSAPRILTLNNQEATIIVGTKFPIIESDVSGDRAIVSTSLEYYEDIGIQLNVVPQICDDEFISMIIHPAVTDQIGTQAGRTGTDSDIPLTEFPVLSTREVETQIMVKSGQTIVIGGLLTDRDTVSVIKVPLLGDLPFLGYLFRRETRNSEKVDLLIFLTATALAGGEGAPVGDVLAAAQLEPPPAEDDMAGAETLQDAGAALEAAQPAAGDPLSEMASADEEAAAETDEPALSDAEAVEAMEATEEALKAEAEKIAEAERRARAKVRKEADEARRAEQARKAAEARMKEAERKADAAAALEAAEKAKAEAEKIAEAERRAKAKRDAIANQTAEPSAGAAEDAPPAEAPEEE